MVHQDSRAFPCINSYFLKKVCLHFIVWQNPNSSWTVSLHTRINNSHLRLLNIHLGKHPEYSAPSSSGNCPPPWWWFCKHRNSSILCPYLHPHSLRCDFPSSSANKRNLKTTPSSSLTNFTKPCNAPSTQALGHYQLKCHCGGEVSQLENRVMLRTINNSSNSTWEVGTSSNH